MRGLNLEPLEDRILMAIGPQLVSIQPNDGDDLLIDGLLPGGAIRHVAPRELTFKFNAGQIIDANTLGGIRITRAGADQMFGTLDDVPVDPMRSGAAGVQRGFVGIGSFPNEVVLRFADTLPDDLYQIRIVGNPADNPLRNNAGEAFDNGLMDPLNTDSVITLNLDLGAQVVGVVPQPVTTLGVDGNWLDQARNQIDVYFNANDPLSLSSAENPTFYQLVFTNDTATNTDDRVFAPSSVNYNPATGKASLIFASDLHALGAGAGTFRLRVGDADVPPHMFAPQTPNQIPGGTDVVDVNSTFDMATLANVLGTLTSTSSIINASIDPQAYTLPFPGSDAEPGHRQIPKEGEGHAGYGGDTIGGIAIVQYNFKPVLGPNPQGGNFLNNITENQKQRAREIFELYGYYAGIQFVETASSGMTVATGDIRAANPNYPPVGGPAGVATGSLAIMNESLSYGISEFGGQWFNIAMHEIGHNLGLGHAYDLPNVTIMGGDGGQNPAGAEPVFPGDTDLVHTRFLHRPDVKDIDLYRFQLDAAGVVALETIAERLASSSALDTLLTVYEEFDALRMPSAGGSTSLLDGKTFTLNDGVHPAVTFEFDLNNTVVETATYRKISFTLGQSASSLAAAVATAITATGNLSAEATSVGDTVRVKSFGAGTLTYFIPGGSPVTLTQNVRELLARNDDYYSEDSFVSLHLTGGEYYVAVTSTGNADFDPTIADSGIGGTTQGQYKLRVDFTPDQTSGIVDADGSPTLLDGDADGQPGGAFNFWFRVSDPFNATNSTVFVDKSAPAAGDGSLANPYNNLIDALADTRLNNIGLTDVDILRLVGNNGDPNNPQPGPDGQFGTLDDQLAYEIGLSPLDGTPLNDGASFNVPKGVTVMVDAGVIVKLRNANIDVGSSSQGVDRSQGHLQVLGTPGNDVYFTSLSNENIGIDSLPDSGAEGTRGDWGGIVFRNDLDLAEKNLPSPGARRILEEEGIFYNFVNRAQIEFGGGSVVVNSVPQVFSPLYMIQARPTLSYNTITNSANAAMSADPNSFADTRFEDNNAGTAYTADYERVGPDIHGNLLTRFDNAGNVVATNTVNGIFVRIRQQLGQSLDVLTLPARFDDTDIVHVLTENLIIKGTPGGPFGSTARIDARLKIDPGMVVKIDGARIETDFSSQLLAEGTQQHPIIITSLSDDQYGTGGTYDTNGDLAASLPVKGDWGGLFFGHTSTASIDHAVIAYGGGSTRIEGGFDRFNVIEIHQADVRITNSTIRNNDDGQATTSRVNRQGNSAATIFVRGAQPVLVGNVIRDNDAEAIDIDANSLQARFVRDWGRATGTIDVFRQFNDNHGPLVRLNRLGNNGTNGMEIRGATLNTDSIWDDTDIVHVLRSEIYLSNHHHNSGLRLESSSNASLVVKLFGANAGFTANGTPLEINDRIGGTIHVVGTPGFPVVLTSLNDDTIGAGFDPIGQPQNDTNNNGASVGAAGQWRSIRLEKYSNDRNSAVINEAESTYTGGVDRNNVAATGQFLGVLAPDEKSGDDNRRLGFEVHGVISHNHTGDVDIYSFNGTAGSEIWLDIDRTTHALDTIVEVLLNDPGNTVIARSNDSTGGDTYDLNGLINNVPLSGGTNFGRSMVRDAFTIPNGADFDTTNPRDAGMRLILPGSVGTTNTYFIRVRSNPAAGNINNVTGGLTSGAYQLQLRLRELDEVPGSTVRHADLRFGGGGTPIAGSQPGAIEVLGLPAHSPLIGESVESTVDNTTIGGAQDLGNLLAADRSTISVAGRIDTVGDVDIYSFTLDYQLVQAIGGVNSGGKTWSTIFDIDYADGLTRANTNISVFDSQGRLIYIGTDSNVSDDQFDPVATSNTTDLSRGSFGNRDPYIGNVQLPEANDRTYYVAISSDERLPTALNMYFTSAAASPLIRLEPVNSLNRIVEDHVGSMGYAEQAQTVPLAPMFGNGTFDQIALNSHAVPFNLSDVGLFVITPGASGELYKVDPFTGRYETEVSGLAGQDVDGTGQGFRDLAMRDDGRLFAYSARNNAAAGSATAGATGNYFEINPGDGVDTNLGDDGVDVVSGGAIPTNHATEYEAWTFTPGGINGRALYAVGQQIRGGTGTNLLYRMNPNTGVEDLANPATPVNPSDPPPIGVINVVNPATEIITGMAHNPSLGNFVYMVSDEGRMYRTPLGSATATLMMIVGGGPVAFTALTAGPQRVEGGVYSGMLFAIGTDNRLYAYQIAGTTATAANVFAIDPFNPMNPGRTSSVNLEVPGAVGLAFSTLDYNLWHVTNRRGSTSAADDGHGINVTPDNNRILDVAGGTSYYFGIEDPRVTPTISESEFLDWFNYTATNAGIFNSYNLPGGAKGSLTTNAFSLVGYSAEDKPTLYFNYFLDTENVNSAIPNTDTMLDSARVFLSNDDGLTWTYMLATNNSTLDPYIDPFLDTELPEFLSSSETASHDPRQRIQELFDDTGVWRQARISLGEFAGMANLRLRFDFTTSADISDVNSPGFYGQVLEGDQYADTRDGNRRGGMNNTGEGFYIDDIIIGFAERGEMATGGNANLSSFFTANVDPPVSDFTEVLTGEYQLEIRRGEEYAVQPDPTRADIILANVFDTNDRHVQDYTLVPPDGNLIGDGQSFVISDGVNRVTFEFDSNFSVIETPTLRRVVFNVASPAVAIAQTIATAVNNAFNAGYLKVTAERVADTRDRTDLFHAASVTTNAPNLGIIQWNPGFFLNQPDRNPLRDQGMILIEKNSIANSAGFGLVVDASTRDNNNSFAHPGATHHLRQLNPSRLAPGVTVENNLLSGGALGGILFSGDPNNNPAAVIPYGRILNNTIYGRSTPIGTGISVTQNAGPTLLNNIVANLALGVSVDGSSLANTVIGGMLYQGNTSNSNTGLGTFEIVLNPGDPLFVSPSTGNFYLAAGSRAIDASINSLSDRPSIVNVSNSAGIPQSPIVAPTIDLFGNTRIDDPTVPPFSGLGSEVFYDRGALERVNTLTIADVSITEGNSGTINIVFGVMLTRTDNNIVSLVWQTTDGTAVFGADYNPTSGTLTFNPGQTLRLLTVQVVGDLLDENNETFLVNLSGEVNAEIADNQAIGTIVDDDVPPTVSIDDITLLEGDVGTTNAVFTVALSAPSGRQVSVNFSTANGVAVAGSDYNSTTGVLTFAPASVTQKLTVQVRGDLTIEPSENFFVNLTGATNATIADNQGEGTITDDDTKLSIGDVTVTEGDSGTTNAVFDVLLSGVSPAAITIVYTTADGTAIGGADYQPTSGTITFASGETSKQVTIAVVGDLSDEFDETFAVNLSDPSSGFILDGQGEATIIDNDPPATILINSVSTVEGDSGTAQAVFTVSISPVSGKVITVEYAAVGATAAQGVDFASTNGTLTFGAGQSTRLVTVLINGDTEFEANETFVVQLSSPNANGVIAGVGQGIGTIRDDEARVSISDASATEDVDTHVVFNITTVDPITGLIKLPVTDLIVAYATSGTTAVSGTDFTAASGDLTFTASLSETFKTISVPILSDLLDENDETFTVTLSGNPIEIFDGTAVGTIVDNDPLPSLAITDQSLVEGNSGTAAMVFTVSLSPVSGRNTSVSFATMAGTASSPADFTAATGNLTFAAGETTKLVTVFVNGDLVGESNETFSVALSNPVNAVLSDGVGTGTIIDDEPRISISPAITTIVEGDSGATTATFVVSLNIPSSNQVTVVVQSSPLTATAGVDYQSINQVLTFAPGETTEVIGVNVLSDLLNEFDEIFNVVLSQATNALIDVPTANVTIDDNDPLPELTISSTSIAEGDAGTTNVVLTVTLAPVSGRNVTVAYATAPGGASSPSDYTATSGTLTFLPLSTQRQITVSVNGDLVSEGDEQFFVNLTMLDGAVTSNPQGVVTIIDDEPKISINDALTLEGDLASTISVFSVTLDKPAVAGVTVNYATVAGTATAGADYAPTTGLLSFGPGQTAQLITVQVLADLLDEHDETFTVQLSNAVNASIVPGGGVGTIIDNDPLPELRVLDTSVLEGDGPLPTSMVFTVTLAPLSGRQVTVAYSTTNGSADATDYTTAQGTLTFAAGETERLITVQVTGDLNPESDETFFLALSNVNHATVERSPGLATIIDDEPRLSISDASVFEGTGGTTNLVFDVTLSKAASSIVSVNYATIGGIVPVGMSPATPGADYTTTSGNLSFGIGVTQQQITVQVAGDALDEDDEVFRVQLGSSTPIIDGDALGIIRDDDDPPAISITSLTQFEGDTGTTPAVFTVTLSAPSGRGVTVDFATAAGTATANTDFNTTSGQLSFAPGVTSAPITVQIRGDLLNENDETFTVGLTNPVNAGLATGSAVGTIRDDEAQVVIGNATVSEGNSGQQFAVFSVTLNKQTGDGVAVGFNTVGGSALANVDFVPTSGTLSFAAGETSKAISVVVNGDTSAEGNETFTVNLTILGNSALPGDLSGLGTILDDDVQPTITINDVTVTEDNVGAVMAVLTVSLSAPSGLTVTVQADTVDGSATAASGDYQPLSTLLTFTPGQSTQQITIAIGGDQRSELNETINVVLSNPSNAMLADVTGVVTIVDNDPQQFLVTGADAGGGPHVRVFNALTGVEQYSFYAYHPSFTGGVRVASADVNGDGQPDIITAPGRGGGPHVRVFDGKTGASIREFFAFEPTFARGLTISAGDVNGDNKADILVATEGGAGESIDRVRVFDGTTLGILHDFTFGPGSPLPGGARIASGDITGDGRADIILSASAGQQPRVLVYNGFTGALVSDFLAYVPAATMGVYVATGDFNGDGRTDIITSPDVGGGPHVRVFSGLAAAANTPSVLSEFMAYHPLFTGGVRVGATDYNGDGFADVITAAGPGGGPHVRVLSGPGLTELASFYAYGALFTGGVHVGGSFRTTGAPLMAANSGSSTSGGSDLTAEQLRPLVNQAISNWAAAGLDQRLLDRLSEVEVRIADLPAGYLGMAYDRAIVLDRDAAGLGWFVDSTPMDDEEFGELAAEGLLAREATAAAHGVDLLTAIAHELGHMLGLADHLDADSLMADVLAEGVRRRPSTAEVDLLFADGQWPE
jgi:hypothetical protein